ncbi:MAG: DJ-1 family protein [Candidatus Buchananbacteria bacterium CG10_big_fil_rev_8_21_14_0_10_42_9]|uniref:DJ-1 family protein n=1 Tax=Candidatus Buchananbacteria bacterium CG10_big_fil_rev_8_21_14_0_10_42_9 TaxID=1974526 RepID=A0A2H0VZT7_9BACT|nr:MAG: DJ-1 family protein [Candidatus Buchananbacteria bacterium CG10_big_fil_rev_8_21_14_0_10_42_9]
MAKAVFIVSSQDFRDEELFKPKSILERGKIKVDVATPDGKEAHGKKGAKIFANLKIIDIDPEKYDAIIFVGGGGAGDFFHDEQVWKLSREFDAQHKIIGAICITPTILANAGILLGRKVTGHISQTERLVCRGAEYSGMPVQIDGNLVTAKFHTDATEFGEKLLRTIGYQ